MTQFVSLNKTSNNVKKLELFEVIENKSHMWLVKYINKRLTTKWFYDYSNAINYYKICLKRHFKQTNKNHAKTL